MYRRATTHLADPSNVWAQIAILGLIVALWWLSLLSQPALAGDEFGSLVEAQDFSINPHAIGYYVQLRLWGKVSDRDAWLRLLSVIWGGVTVLACWQWARAIKLPPQVTWMWCLLLGSNAFFLQYAIQVRFYAYFLATSTLLFWRLATYLNYRTLSNLAVLVLSAILLVTSHLFGWLVLGIACATVIWSRSNPRIRVLAMVIAAVVPISIFVPSIRGYAVRWVYSATAHLEAPEEIARGLTPAMFAKVPMTMFFFGLGERVYPLVWWITLPSVIIISFVFLRGLWRVVSYPTLGSMVSFTLLSVVGMFLILDPLAPPSLQGAAPRYVLYALPVFLLICVVGAGTSRMLTLAIGGVNLVGLLMFLWPTWSYSGLDLFDWPRQLNREIGGSDAACIVVDGRSLAAVERYAPSTAVITSNISDCLRYHRLLLVTNDYRLSTIRYFDQMETSLSKDYDLVTNVTQFPAQIVVYQRDNGGSSSIVPARLDLPEQDLRLPLTVPERGWTLPGFVRLDAETPSYEGPMVASAPLYVVTNYRSSVLLPVGAPVLSVTWLGSGGQSQSVVLRSRIETAAWDGQCSQCEAIASWTKLVHLVGARAYPDAYRQYQAMIWGAQVEVPTWPVSRVRVTSQLANGTVYFWGVYPARSAMP